MTKVSAEDDEYIWRSTGLTTIFPYGRTSYACAYCKCSRKDTACSFGFNAISFSPADYDRLMLHGWSRSGNFIYLPLNHVTCCPQYAIRQKPLEFTPTPSQRKAWRRFERLLSPSSDGQPPQLTITRERATYSDEKFELFQKYSVAVHEEIPEDVTQERFSEFLVDSPMNIWLQRHSLPDTMDSIELGTFHELYRTQEGRLIAVGVQDILPSGLISVYFFYDPDYRHWSLGRCSALHEIDYCRQRQYTSYYMGYYVHNCRKMQYKREYLPTDVLCPSTYEWVPIDTARCLFDQHAFTPLVEPFVSLRQRLDEQIQYLETSERELLEEISKRTNEQAASLAHHGETANDPHDGVTTHTPEANTASRLSEGNMMLLRHLHEAKENLLEPLISVASRGVVHGYQTSPDDDASEAWERHMPHEALVDMVQRIPLFLRFSVGELVEVHYSHLIDWVSRRVEVEVFDVLAHLIRYLSWDETTCGAYAVYFR